MRRLIQILCATVGLSTVSCYAIAYIGGKQGMPLSLEGFPAQIVPLLLSMLCIISLFITFVVALIQRRERLLTLSMIGLAFTFFILPFAVVPTASFFLSGFRARINSIISPNELRQIALAAQNILPEQGVLPGPDKSLWNEEGHRAQWNSLSETTAISKLDPWMVIFKHPDSIELTWGSALTGHWGIIIDTGIEQRDGDIAKGIRTHKSR